MNEQKIDLEFIFALSKCRNICYYYNIDDRPRKVYFKVLRNYRKQILSLIKKLNDNDKRKNIVYNILKSIPSNVNNNDCGQVISNLEKIIKNVKF